MLSLHRLPRGETVFYGSAPMEGVAYTPFTLTPVADRHTRVKWDVIGTNKYPFNLTNLFADKLMGPDMEKSLIRLKDILEKR